MMASARIQVAITSFCKFPIKMVDTNTEWFLQVNVLQLHQQTKRNTFSNLSTLLMEEFLSIGITMTIRMHPLFLLEVVRH